MSKKLSLSAAEAAFERAKAELKEARAREASERKQKDLHRKIVGGAFLLTLLPSQPKILQAFWEYLSPKDRRYFEDEFAAIKAAQPGSAAAKSAAAPAKTVAP